MLNRTLIPLLLLVFILAACGGNGQPVETEAPATLPPEPSLPTETPLPPAATSTSGTSEQAVEPAAGCTVVSTSAEPSAEQESLFPRVSGEDYVKGPETAKVTIIEYSDFQ
jgi:hypothetical protein